MRMAPNLSSSNVPDRDESPMQETFRNGSEAIIPKDDGDEIPVLEEEEEATWRDVYVACCIHSPTAFMYGVLRIMSIIFCLWCFLVTLDLMGTSAQVMTGCAAGSLFGDNFNPVASLMIGVVTTALIQSSSTTTSIIVSMTESVITVEQGIYMVMGANIGTTITNTIVAIGQMGDGDQLERAFAGATVHDMFNYLTVAVLFPLEVVSGYLYVLSKAVTKNVTLNPEGEAWSTPLDKIIEPVSDRIILRNRGLITAVAEGSASCSSFYPIVCNGPPSDENCEQVGLIPCGDFGCPFFFDENASLSDDKISGAIMFLLSVFALFTCMAVMSYQLSSMLKATSSRVVRKATNLNGYLAIAVGCAITVFVQSSSITTSALTPLVGLDILKLEQMYPLTLGANIGTTVTAILAAVVQATPEAMQVAMSHLFFNLTGIAIWYPIPFMRAVPMYLARQLGKGTRIWKGFPFVYIFVAFFLIPLVALLLSSLVRSDSVGLVVLGSVLCVGVFFYLFYLAYQCKYNGLAGRTVEHMKKRQHKREFMESLEDKVSKLEHDVSELHARMLEKHLEKNTDDVLDEETGKLLDEQPAKAVDEEHGTLTL